MIRQISAQEFKDFASKLTVEKETWSDVTRIWDEDWSEADVALIMFGFFEWKTGEMVGMCHLKPTQIPGCLEAGAVVRKDYWGKKVGYALTATYVTAAICLGATSMVAKVSKDNVAALMLDLKYGWTVEEFNGHYWRLKHDLGRRIKNASIDKKGIKRLAAG